MIGKGKGIQTLEFFWSKLVNVYKSISICVWKVCRSIAAINSQSNENPRDKCAAKDIFKRKL